MKHMKFTFNYYLSFILIPALLVLATSLISQASTPNLRTSGNPAFKAKKLRVAVVPASGLSGSRATLTVTGATPNGQLVRIEIGGSGTAYRADSKGKVVTRAEFGGAVGDKVNILAEDLSPGTYPPPTGQAVYTITGLNRSNSALHSPGHRTGSTAVLPIRGQ